MPLAKFGVGPAIGCGISTGTVPALRSTTASEPGSLVAVVGCGGVGLSVVAGARLAGARRIVAVDRSPVRLERAGRLGADLVIDASLVRPGGQLTLLGKLAMGDGLSIRFGSLMGHKTVRRLAYGGAVIRAVVRFD